VQREKREHDLKVEFFYQRKKEGKIMRKQARKRQIIRGVRIILSGPDWEGDESGGKIKNQVIQGGDFSRTSTARSKGSEKA